LEFGHDHRDELGGNTGSSTVKFNGTSGTPTNWSTTSIVVPVPSGATTGNVVVHASGVDSNGQELHGIAHPEHYELVPDHRGSERFGDDYGNELWHDAGI